MALRDVPWQVWVAAAGVGLFIATRKTIKLDFSGLFGVGVDDPRNLLGTVDPQTRMEFQRLASRFNRRTGLSLQVRSGRRTCAEQRRLFSIGRTTDVDAPKVTFADGCRSWHVLGRAIDTNVVDAKGNRVGGCDVFTTAGEIWEQMGGKWGGRFSGFGPCGDAGHFEWHPGLSIEDLCPDPAACESVVSQAPFVWQ